MDVPQGPVGAPGQVVVISAQDGGSIVIDGGVAIVSGPQGPPGPVGPYGEDSPNFIGFTSALTTGFANGRNQLHTICATEFSGAHLCHYSEYMLANPRTPIPAVGAWIDGSGGPPGGATPPLTQWGISRIAGRYVGGQFNCGGWSTASSGAVFGTALSTWPHDLVACSAQRSVACCNSPFRERFAGTTAQAFDGNAGGFEGMNLRCHQSFANSHLCSFSEFHRAAATTTLPASVWIQPSASMTNAPADNPPTFTNPSFATCTGWTSATGLGTVFIAAQSPQADTLSCAITMPLACCF